MRGRAGVASLIIWISEVIPLPATKGSKMTDQELQEIMHELAGRSVVACMISYMAGYYHLPVEFARELANAASEGHSFEELIHQVEMRLMFNPN